MSFDGTKYRHAAFTLPTYYHPASAFQSQAISNCLRNAYFSAQHQSRMILQQTYGGNFQSPEDNQSEFMIKNNDFLTIAKGYVFIPENVTHISAQVVFATLIDRAGAAQHKITIENSSAESKSATLTSEIRESTGIETMGQRPFSNQLLNFIDFQRSQTATVSAVIETAGTPLITLGEKCTVTVKAYAYHTEPAGTPGLPDLIVAEVYRPQFVNVFFEVRE